MLHYLYGGIFFISSIIHISCDKPVYNPSTKDMQQQTTPETFQSWINADYVMGKFEPEEHKDFVLIEQKYADRTGLYLQKEAYTAFVEMWNKAKEDNLTLIIKSATRNFTYQKGIWERKWSGQTVLSDGTKANDIASVKDRASKILLYSSMPGTSRHHWGTDIDLNSFNNSYFSKGEGLKLYEWLEKHAQEFGFCQPYTSKATGRTGYEEEKWHWSYMPLSKELTRYSSAKLKNDMIIGFDGHEAASDLDVVKNYILGINKQCF